MNREEKPARVRLMDTFRNLFYTPIYVAVAGGHFYAYGIDVMFSMVPPDRSSINMLKSGDADIVQTGISRSLMDLDEGHEDAPIHVAEINRGDGFFILSRTLTGEWAWQDLEGASLAPIGFTPVPWMSFRRALRDHGVDEDKIRLVQRLSAEDAIARFRAGEVDHLHMVNPQARMLEHENIGRIVASIGEDLGRICYSSFAATSAYVDSHPETVRRFVAGFYSAQSWVASSPVEVIAERVATFFPGIPETVLLDSIGDYKRLGTWATSPQITRESYESMRDLLIEGGLVRGRFPYERVVRSEFAEAAVNLVDGGT